MFLLLFIFPITCRLQWDSHVTNGGQLHGPFAFHNPRRIAWKCRINRRRPRYYFASELFRLMFFPSFFFDFDTRLLLLTTTTITIRHTYWQFLLTLSRSKYYHHHHYPYKIVALLSLDKLCFLTRSRARARVPHYSLEIHVSRCRCSTEPVLVFTKILCDNMFCVLCSIFSILSPVMFPSVFFVFSSSRIAERFL